MGNCGSGGGEIDPHLFELNFVNPKGTDSEAYNEIKPSLGGAKEETLDKLRAFKGCGDLIREAISSPSPATEESAWSAVVPSVEILKELYEYSKIITHNYEVILRTLSTEAVGDEDLADHQALTKALAELFDFVLKFDDLKMTNPAIQNDFSYYRRILNRMKNSNKTKDAGVSVNDELANAMSLFFAYPTPMMTALINTSTTLVTNHAIASDMLSKILARLCNSCFHVLETKTDLSEDAQMLYLRTITASIILYDHVNQKGAFHKKSPIQLKGAINVLKAYHGREKTDNLINALRFNTLHLNEEETPAQIKAILE